MLISFSVRNFRTFRDKVEWSLIASPDRTREEDNVIDVPAFGLRLLKSAVVYGANASGKSKLIEAFDYMRRFMVESSKNSQIDEPTGVEPFLLNKDSIKNTSEFEVQFVYQNIIYRYGFELSNEKIEAEWLYIRNSKTIRNKPEIELFYRDKQEILFDNKRFGGIVNELVKNKAVRENALLLSVAAQFNQPRAVAILEWIHFIIIMSGENEDVGRALTFLLMRTDVAKYDILNFLVNADLDIEDLRQNSQRSSLGTWETEKERTHILRKWIDKENSEIKTKHKVYDEHGIVDYVEFDLVKNESIGTRKMLDLAGPILTAIKLGQLIVVDELDARLHPNLVSKIVQLFNSKETNPNNAQLLFNTHDTNLLTSGNFRRDQIWFTEKNRYGEATLYSLADFKTDVVRKGDNLEANYVRGKYGAVPYLGDFNALPKANADADPKPQNGHE